MDNKKKRKGTLIIIDMQNDFITGSLANPAAQAIVDPIVDLIGHWAGNVVATRDTHAYNYLTTLEGKKLPIEHCLMNTSGWCIEDRIMRALYERGNHIIDKRNSFAPNWGTNSCGDCLLDDVFIVGTCTDICVISSALVIKSAYPDKNVAVFEDLCAGTTPERHKAAIEVMKSCQIDILTCGPEEKPE